MCIHKLIYLHVYIHTSTYIHTPHISRYMLIYYMYNSISFIHFICIYLYFHILILMYTYVYICIPMYTYIHTYCISTITYTYIHIPYLGILHGTAMVESAMASTWGGAGVGSRIMLWWGIAVIWFRSKECGAAARPCHCLFGEYGVRGPTNTNRFG